MVRQEGCVTKHYSYVITASRKCSKRQHLFTSYGIRFSAEEDLQNSALSTQQLCDPFS